MTYSLLQSQTKVVTVVVELGGVEQDRIEGKDLRKVAASYFQAPQLRGSYQLTVTALDVNDCASTADRPMTVTVQ